MNTVGGSVFSGYRNAEEKDKTTDTGNMKSMSKIGSETFGDPVYKRLSDYVTSPVFTIHVGPTNNRRQFHIHSALLAKESYFLADYINSDSKEAAARSIELDGEDPDLFRYFVSFIYTSTGMWRLRPLDKSQKQATDYLTLARLYTLGDRLDAPDFQRSVLADFMSEFATALLSDTEVCQLLDTVMREMPNEYFENFLWDPLKNQILWCLSRRIETVSKCEEFTNLLWNIPELAIALCERAGNSSAIQPSYNAKDAALERDFQ